MTKESGSFWSTLPGLFTALGALIGSVAGLITALHAAGIFGLVLGSGSSSQPSEQTTPDPGRDPGTSDPSLTGHQRSTSSTSSTSAEAAASTPYSATYEGYSTEGSTQNAIRINFTRQGNLAFGTYSLNGMPGSIRGQVNGKILHYAWQLGTHSGLGIASESNGLLQGRWGYGESPDNAGILEAQRVGF